MFIRLLPDQIARYWDMIRLSLVQTWPVLSSPEIQNLLLNLLSENLQCWFSMKEDEPACVILTRISICDMTHIRSLQIVTLYGLKPLELKEWEEGLRKLSDFAKAMECKTITATTNNERILQIVRRFKFTEQSFISMEV